MNDRAFWEKLTENAVRSLSRATSGPVAAWATSGCPVFWVTPEFADSFGIWFKSRMNKFYPELDPPFPSILLLTKEAFDWNKDGNSSQTIFLDLTQNTLPNRQFAQYIIHLLTREKEVIQATERTKVVKPKRGPARVQKSIVYRMLSESATVSVPTVRSKPQNKSEAREHRVPGYWRNQRYGPGNKLTKRIFIPGFRRCVGNGKIADATVYVVK